MDINNAIQTAAQTALTMYSAMPVKIALLVVALLFCFAGFKLLRGVTALLGVVLGVACGTCLPELISASMTPFIEMVLTILAMVVLGVVCGIICFRFYQLGVFLVFAIVGVGIVYVPALFVAERSMTAFWVILAVGALLFGVTSVLFLRPVSIVVTSCFGFAAAFPMMELLEERIGAQPMWMTIALGAVLTVLGLAVQLLTNRKADAHPFGAEDDEEDDEEEDADESAAPVAAQPDEIDSVSDSTQRIDMSQMPQEEPDEIDSISDLIAARIGLAEPDTQPLTEASVHEMTRRLEEPETSAEQTEGLETLDLAKQMERQMAETAKRAASAQPEESVPEAAVDVEDAAERTDEAEQTAEEPPEPIDPVTRLLDAMRPQAKISTVPAEEKTEPLRSADEPTAVLEETQTEPDDEPTAVLEETQTEPDNAPTEIGNEPTQLLEELPAPEPEEEASAQDAPAETPKPKKHANPLHVAATVLLAAGALFAATLGFQYVEVVLALSFVCYLCGWYRTAAFPCAILCVRRAADAVLLYTQTSGFVLGLNHTTWELVMDGISCLTLLLLTFVAVHSYTESRHADGNKK